MRRHMQIILSLLIIVLPAALTAEAQVASNPPYTLEQAVIASGGGTSVDTGNQFSITGAIGQPIADTSSTSPYIIKSGFFTAAAPLVPTAAAVSIGGRVLTGDGRGIRNVILIMTDASGSLRTATTTAFGYYRFADVTAGETYIITARGKRYTFAQPTLVLNINDENNEINFIGNPTSSFRESQ